MWLIRMHEVVSKRKGKGLVRWSCMIGQKLRGRGKERKGHKPKLLAGGIKKDGGMLLLGCTALL